MGQDFRLPEIQGDVKKSLLTPEYGSIDGVDSTVIWGPLNFLALPDMNCVSRPHVRKGLWTVSKCLPALDIRPELENKIPPKREAHDIFRNEF